MTGEQFDYLAAMIRENYRWAHILETEVAMELWYRSLEDIPYDFAEQFFFGWVASHGEVIKISDFRKAYTEANLVALPDWGSQWELVQSMIRKYGYPRPEKAIEQIKKLGSTVTANVVQKIGWQNLCESQEPMADRANFRMLYEQLAEKENEKRALPVKVRARLEDISGRMVENRLIGIGEAAMLTDGGRK